MQEYVKLFMQILGYNISKIKKKNALHPEFKKATEYAFSIDGQDFYHFKNYLDIPVMRFQKMQEFIREVEMRMTRDDLVELIEIIESGLNEGNITKVAQVIAGIKFRLDLFIETETYYRLFSCVFFTLEEDLTDYDVDYNETKIELFKSQPKDAFFLKSPMREYLPPVDISTKDMQTFLDGSEAAESYLQKIKSNNGKNSKPKT